MLLSTIINCHRQLNISQTGLEIDTAIQEDVAELTEGIISSIPYLLAADLQTFIDNTTRGIPPIVPGRSIGGLLSMHALYVLSALPMTEKHLKVYLRDCLAWIGTRMGIGQATILSRVRIGKPA
jgi:hypothetical protein